MPQEAELIVYVRLDGQTPKLYSSETATQPLPSHELVLNDDVVCTFHFIVVGDTFKAPGWNDWLQWFENESAQAPTPGYKPPGFDESTCELSNDDTQASFRFTNPSGGGEVHYRFNLFLNQNGAVSFYQNGVPVDPTVVEKPPG